ncbi:MAG: DUF3343 domain-containing protein [Clostridiales bacterium]|nr:DUF3343 domain-containing protein [Clostridiales bacterium]
MISYLAAFRSRSQAIRLYDLLRASGYSARIVNTPREAGVGCGISVNFPSQNFGSVRALLSRNNFTAFAGWFGIDSEIGKCIRINA